MGTSGPRNSASGCHSSLAVERSPRRPPTAGRPATPTSAERGEQRDGPRRLRAPREQRPAPLPADQQPDHDRHQRQRAAADQRVDDEVGEHLPDPRLGALRLAGDQRVAVDQHRRCWARRSCRAGSRRRPARPTAPARRAAPDRCSSTTWPDRSGRSTASWLASVVSRLLCRKIAAAQASVSSDPGGDVRRAPQDAGASRRHACSAAGLRHRVEGDRGGDAGVEGLDLVGHRDRDAAGRRSRRPGGTARRPRSRPPAPAGRRRGRSRAATRRRPRPGRRPCSRPPGSS